MPRRSKTVCSSSAASLSSPGRTRSRLDTSVTCEPIGEVGVGELRAGDAGADDDEVLGQLGQVVELAPVEDALAVGLGALDDARARARWRAARRRPRPSSVAVVGDVDLDDVRPAAGRPSRARRVHALALRAGAVMSADCASASALTRALTSSTAVDHLAVGVHARRGRRARSDVIASLVAMKVLDGTQSDSTHCPPTPSRSTSVTSAPSCTATSAAS